MAIKKAKEFRDLDIQELRFRAAELQKEMFDLRRQVVSKELSKSSLLQDRRRDYARLLTVINEKSRS